MRIRALVVLVVVIVAAGAAAAAAWTWSQLWRPRSAADVEVVVEAGTSGREVLQLLEETDLVPSTLAGRLYLRFAAEGQSIRFGHYRIAAGSRPVDVLDRLLEGRVEMLTVTVLEGSDISEVATQMAAAGIGDEAEWRVLATRVDWVSDLVPEAASLEGFFFPDTYQFAEGIGTEAAARHLVERFRLVWTEERARVETTWGDLFETMTLASLVEAETPLSDERERVSGVFVNRLRRGMLLQCDPTVVFALKRRGEWNGRLFRIHWGVDDPYNTYRFPGLPPGPINSPGRASIRAALSPEDHRYLYFVAAPEGGHVFSHTLAEHNRAVALWQRSRR